MLNTGLLTGTLFLSPRIEKAEKKVMFSLVFLVTASTKHSTPNTKPVTNCYSLININ